MAKQTINVGTTANDRTGDPLRTAFTKVNANFTELYANVASLSSEVINDISELTDTQGILFSGSYNDLSNTPFIPSDLNDLSDSTNLLINREYVKLTGTFEGSNNIVSFAKPPNTLANVSFDVVTNEITLTRDAEGIGGLGGGIYNSAAENAWDDTISPVLTLWNWEGWDDLTDVENRFYEPLRQVLKHRIGENIVGAELIMKDTINNEYYKFKFAQWAQGAAHDGSFAYTREKIDTSTPAGIVFSDGSTLTKRQDTRVNFPQSYIGDFGDYIITDKDVGRQLYAYGNTMDIPSGALHDFKIGDTIQIIAGHQATALRPIVNLDPELPDAVLYVQGTANSVPSFTIPARSMALLTKTGDDSWQLSIGNDSVINGSITFPDNTVQNTAWAGGRIVEAPNTSIGEIGDTVGDIAFSNTHFYYCTTDYTDGMTNIWKRVAWSNDTW